MQQLHSITGASPARFFPVGCDGSSLSTIHNSNAATSSFMDRRLRPQLQHHQIVKCPRCDSPNTKFCYYNNYNLSQPRHFCKSCRRYWTKGGVLRNVPVGGGCRKSKRSNSTSSPSSTSSSSNPKSSKLKVENHRESRRCPRSNSRSSSDSSSLTVVAPAIPCPILLVDSVPTIVEADQGKIVPTETGIDLPSTMPYEFPDYRSSTFSIPNQGYEQNQINADNDHHVFAAVEEMSLPDDMGVGFLDQTVPVDLPPLLDGRIGNSNADLTGLDWQGCLDPTVGFFDAGTSTVAGGDQGLFWPLV